MSKISNFFTAIIYSGHLSKNVVFQRLNCRDRGHDLKNSVTLDKLHSENHPWNDSEFVYTVNIRQCYSCGMVFQSCGLEFKDHDD